MTYLPRRGRPVVSGWFNFLAVTVLGHHWHFQRCVHGGRSMSGLLLMAFFSFPSGEVWSSILYASYVVCTKHRAAQEFLVLDFLYRDMCQYIPHSFVPTGIVFGSHSCGDFLNQFISGHIPSLSEHRRSMGRPVGRPLNVICGEPTNNPWPSRSRKQPYKL